ncbi:MAG: SufD family Fe-S cluster assembly protein [Candidatus Omnitrophica bacterium]|nr:SufD family Fe-S cluster assembly protein [Candidatus Omnitrophota bacterium]
MSSLTAEPTERTLAAWALSALDASGSRCSEWLGRFRAESLSRLEADGFPRPQEDAWRNMGLDGLLKPVWRRAEDRSLLTLPPSQSGVELKSWDDLAKMPDPSAGRLESGPFASFNAAFMDKAFSVRAARNVCCLQPLRFTPEPRKGSAAGWMINPRASVLLEPGSRLDLILDLSQLPAEQGLLNLVMDIQLCDQTALNLVVAGADSEAAISLLDLSVLQGRDSVFRLFALETQAAQSRIELAASLQGQNASTDLFGLALLGKASRVFHHFRVDHRVPHTQSQQVFKSVLGGEARYEFDSLATIHPEAPHCSSEQLNKNLVLSDSARAYARPQLAIHTDEVQCHHGATVGQMSAEELLYLRTRGIHPAAASSLIMRGFVDDLLKEIPVSSAVADLQRRAHARLEEIAQ